MPFSNLNQSDACRSYGFSMRNVSAYSVHPSVGSPGHSGRNDGADEPAIRVPASDVGRGRIAPLRVGSPRVARARIHSRRRTTAAPRRACLPAARSRASPDALPRSAARCARFAGSAAPACRRDGRATVTRRTGVAAVAVARTADAVDHRRAGEERHSEDHGTKAFDAGVHGATSVASPRRGLAQTPRGRHHRKIPVMSSKMRPMCDPRPNQRARRSASRLADTMASRFLVTRSIGQSHHAMRSSSRRRRTRSAA